MNLYEIFEIEKNELDVKTLSPLTWAYVGDCVYELYIRTNLVSKTRLKPHKLHIEAIKYVKAKAQAQILQDILETLSEEEQDIVRRTRNTQNHHLPKNAELKDYMYATAFEGLIGYLYLTKQEQRLKEILDISKTTLEKRRLLKKCLTKWLKIWYNYIYYTKWPVGQAAKTPPSQGGIMGSIPVRVTNATKKEYQLLILFFCCCQK